jgi:hypothetical protein
MDASDLPSYGYLVDGRLRHASGNHHDGYGPLAIVSA